MTMTPATTSAVPMILGTVICSERNRADPMRVTTVRGRWLEHHRRKRRWMSLQDAASRLREDLQRLVLRLEHTVGTKS